jgi:PHP family Zn ribbon phosphoesterase
MRCEHCGEDVTKSVQRVVQEVIRDIPDEMTEPPQWPMHMKPLKKRLRAKWLAKGIIPGQA